MDPMHGTYLHKMSHSMSEGEVALRLDVARELPRKSKH